LITGAKQLKVREMTVWTAYMFDIYTNFMGGAAQLQINAYPG